MKHRDQNTILVHSTESSGMCPSCGTQTVKCKGENNKNNLPKGDGNVRVARSTKGRKGKGVSLISGLTLEDASLKELAKKLKQKCGTGGTLKNGVIEIQGDCRDLLVEELNKLGFNAKKAGG